MIDPSAHTPAAGRNYESLTEYGVLARGGGPELDISMNSRRAPGTIEPTEQAKQYVRRTRRRNMEYETFDPYAPGISKTSAYHQALYKAIRQQYGRAS